MPIPTLFAAVAATWFAYLAALWYASRRAGTGHPVEDYRMRFRVVDLVGVPIGVLTQLVVVPLVYLPLSRIWPATFYEDELSENAERLVDRAERGDDGPARADGLRRCPDRRGARLSRAAAGLLRRPGRRRRRLADRRRPGSPSSTSAPSSTPVCSRSASSPAPASSSPGASALPIATHVAFNVTGLLLAVADELPTAKRARCWHDLSSRWM